MEQEIPVLLQLTLLRVLLLLMGSRSPIFGSVGDTVKFIVFGVY